MAKVSKREWTLPNGEVRMAWSADYHDDRGRRRRKQFRTQREAKRFLTEIEHKLMTGTYLSVSEDITVRQMVEDWLEDCEVRKNASQIERSTFEDYRAWANRYILADDYRLADVPLIKLTRSRVIDFRNDMVRNDLSESLTRRILTVLRLAAKHGMERGWITTNPAGRIEVRSSTRIKKRVKIPDRATVKALIEDAADDFRPMLLIAVFAGLRSSEVRALQWGDIDFDGGYIKVRRRVDRYNQIGEPKSNSGVRDVPIGPLVVNALRTWRGDKIQTADALVFATSKGTPILATNVQRRWWYPLLQSNGLKGKVRFHDLRHFAVSNWISRNATPKAVSTWAGHSSINITFDVYGALFPEPDHGEMASEIETLVLATGDR